MKKITLLLVLTLLVQLGNAQRNFGKLVGSLEMGFDVSHLTTGITPRFIPSFHLDVPVESFAFGIGVGRKYYQAYEYPVFAGQVIQREENGVLVTRYKSNIRSFDPAYWTIPIKAEVRVHRCQCVFLQAGMSVDILDDSTPDRLEFSGAELEFQSFNEFRHDQLFKKRTTSYTLGIGFNLFRTQGFRLIARPSIVWSENPEIYTEAPKFISTLRMNFGAQVAILR